MKKIEAIIKPHRIEDIRTELSQLGIIGIMTDRSSGNLRVVHFTPGEAVAREAEPA